MPVSQISEVNKALTDILGGFPEIGRVLLFGSWAKGFQRPGSDVDLAVITRGQMLRPDKLRLINALLLAFAVRGIEADLVVKGSKEFEAEKDLPSTMAHTIATEGKVLWTQMA